MTPDKEKDQTPHLEVKEIQIVIADESGEERTPPIELQNVRIVPADEKRKAVRRKKKNPEGCSLYSFGCLLPLSFCALIAGIALQHTKIMTYSGIMFFILSVALFISVNRKPKKIVDKPKKKDKSGVSLLEWIEAICFFVLLPLSFLVLCIGIYWQLPNVILYSFFVTALLVGYIFFKITYGDDGCGRYPFEDFFLLLSAKP